LDHAPSCPGCIESGLERNNVVLGHHGIPRPAMTYFALSLLRPSPSSQRPKIRNVRFGSFGPFRMVAAMSALAANSGSQSERPKRRLVPILL
jgi:hypothetical protein